MKLAYKIMVPLATLFVSAAAAAQSIHYSVSVSGFTNNFEVQSFSWGVSNAAVANPQLYKGQKGSISTLNLQKLFDGNSASLQAACFQGTPFSSVEMIGFSDTGQTIIDILLTRSFVASDQIGGAEAGGLPSESVSFSATHISVNGTPINLSTIAGVQAANKMIASILHKAKSDPK